MLDANRQQAGSRVGSHLGGELRHIQDPADAHGPDFPGETFRVLKEKEIAKFGEYRTGHMVLEAWERLPPQ